MKIIKEIFTLTKTEWKIAKQMSLFILLAVFLLHVLFTYIFGGEYNFDYIIFGGFLCTCFFVVMALIELKRGDTQEKKIIVQDLMKGVRIKRNEKT